MTDGKFESACIVLSELHVGLCLAQSHVLVLRRNKRYRRGYFVHGRSGHWDIRENGIFMIARFAGMPSPFHFSISMHDAACDSTVGTSVYC